jgi:phosphatidylserine decarboxylase
MSIADDLLISVMRILPKKSLSRLMGRLARLKPPRPLLRRALALYVDHYGVDVSEAERPIGEYESFDDFFTRRLKPGARPIDEDPDSVLSPCDGTVLSAGDIAHKHILQAKGKRYSLGSFLEDSGLADTYAGGSQATIYLHPRNYHRVHAPVSGRIAGYRYVPGHLFPVNRAAVDRVDDLFAVNERLITLIDSYVGRVAVGMVGAYGVGEITVSYDTIRTNAGGPEIVRRDFETPIPVQAGAEVGTFHLGSTVILLFSPGRVELSGLTAGQPVRMGQVIGRRIAGRGRLRIIQGH